MGVNLLVFGKMVEDGKESHLMKRVRKSENMQMEKKKYTLNHPSKNYPLRTFNLLLTHLLTYIFL